jgi:adenosyl cobinamide kinase/adenosyl cobinamide phosphate guanylyltransferase
MGTTLVLGGARSGKSRHAIDRATRSGLPVTFIATAPRGIDADFDDRIERHVADRPHDWATMEAPVDLLGALAAALPGFVVIDCLSLWTSNLVLADHADDAIVDAAHAAAAAAVAHDGHVVAVSNEVGSGVHPPSELGRRFRDVHGRVNQAWSAAADEAVLVVAGRPLRLGDWSDRDGGSGAVTP